MCNEIQNNTNNELGSKPISKIVNHCCGNAEVRSLSMLIMKLFVAQINCDNFPFHFTDSFLEM